MVRTFVATTLALLALLPLAAMPAKADLYVSFDMDSAKLNYVAATTTLTVTDSLYSMFNVRLEESVLGGTNILDTARITNNGQHDFSLLFTMNLVDLAGPNNWSATGNLSFTDKNGLPYAAIGNFTSTSIKIVSGGAGKLEIEGYLLGVGGNPINPILVNRGDPWVFVGASQSDDNDADGVLGQITVPNSQSYDTGWVTTLKFGVNTLWLDELFASDKLLPGGEIKGTVIPAPAAVVLGLFGLGAVGWYMRRFA